MARDNRTMGDFENIVHGESVDIGAGGPDKTTGDILCDEAFHRWVDNQPHRWVDSLTTTGLLRAAFNAGFDAGAPVGKGPEPEPDDAKGDPLRDAELEQEAHRKMLDPAHGRHGRPYRPGGLNDPAVMIDQETIARRRLYAENARLDDLERSYDKAMRKLDRNATAVDNAMNSLDPRVPGQDRDFGRLQAFMGIDRVVYWVPTSEYRIVNVKVKKDGSFKVKP